MSQAIILGSSSATSNNSLTVFPKIPGIFNAINVEGKYLFFSMELMV